MRDGLAHVARWRFADKRTTLGVAVMPPIGVGFWTCVGGVYVPTLNLMLFDHSRLAIQAASETFGATVCSLCLALGTPCWRWRDEGFYELSVPPPSHGWIATNPLASQDDDFAARAVQDRNNTISQLTTNSVDLRAAMEAMNPPSVERRPALIQQRTERDRRRQAAVELATDSLPSVRQAPTPAGTIRCTHCGQVIPPGFDKATDPKKTEDEIYASCQHIFDVNTKICSKCNLKERTERGRFSWLEVD